MKTKSLPVAWLSAFLLLMEASLHPVLLVAADSSTAVPAADAASFGFAPEATGAENTKALQRAVDRGGTIWVTKAGTYPIAGTVYLGSHTTLIFGAGVYLKKVADQGPFSHVLLNKGALTRIDDEDISVQGLQVIVNGVDYRMFKDVFGLHGQLAFFHVRNLRIEHFRCLDLGRAQYGIQVCAFEDLLVQDVLIRGLKDGVHLGHGKRFTIRDGIFETGDDAVALNAHDYATGCPELGWIENGIVENCHDLTGTNTAGYFCRILAGAWTDWREGMVLQNSDIVVSAGKLYRVIGKADGKTYTSVTPPTHPQGTEVLDGISWLMVQTNITYTAGVRNVTFRDIFMEKPRVCFSIHFDNDRYSRSYYPGAPIPLQTQLTFDNIRVLHDVRKDFLSIGTPVDTVSIVNSSLRDNPISFRGNGISSETLRTRVNMVGCIFNHPGKMDLLLNSASNRVVTLRTTGSTEVSEHFTARISPGSGSVVVDSDLSGLRR